MEAPKYYDNSKGTLYQLAEWRYWPSYLFDIVKRLNRNGKKDDIKLEIEKSILVFRLWLQELENDKDFADLIVEKLSKPRWSLDGINFELTDLCLTIISKIEEARSYERLVTNIQMCIDILQQELKNSNND